MNRLLTRWLPPAMLTASAVVMLGIVGTAQGAWLPTEPIVPSGPAASDVQVAADAKGDVFVAWVTANPGHAIVVSEHPAGGSWSPAVQRIPATQDCQEPSLAVNEAGAAILVADCRTGTTPMRYAVRSIYGTWSSITGEIPGSGSGRQPRAGIDSTGNLAVAWQTESSPSAVDAVYAPVGGGFGAVKQISTAGKVATNPNLAMTPTGTVDLVWLEQRKQNGADPVVQVMIARKRGSQEWGASGHLTSNFTNTPVAFGEPQIEVDGTYQIVAWTQEEAHPEMIARNTNGDGNGFSEPIVGVAESGLVYGPSVGIDLSGRSIATWRSIPTGPAAISVRSSSTSSPTGFWATPYTVDEVVSGSPALAVTPTGFSSSAWYAGGGVIHAATRPAGGVFGGPVTLNTPQQFGYEEPVMTNDGEDSVVVWNTSDHPAVAVEDRTAPALAPTATPATLGSATSFTADATDAWGPVSVTWDFGDGATATGATAEHTYASAGPKTATVTATDAAGNVATATVEAEVTAPPPPGGGGGGTGGGEPPASPPAPVSPPTHPTSPARSTVGLTAAAVAQPWQKQSKARAVRVRCKLDVAGSCGVVATLGRAVARGLGLAVPQGSPTRVGKGAASPSANRFAPVKVKLTAKALAAIAASPKPVPLTLTVTATAADREPATRTLRLTLHP